MFAAYWVAPICIGATQVSLSITQVKDDRMTPQGSSDVLALPPRRTAEEWQQIIQAEWPGAAEIYAMY